MRADEDVSVGMEYVEVSMKVRDARGDDVKATTIKEK